MNQRMLMLLCLCIAGVSASAQTQATAPKCEDTTVDAFGPKVAADARQFLLQLQNAVRSDDRNAVASMINYPLHAYGKGGPITISSKADFLKLYDQIWTNQVKQSLFLQSPACLGYAASGYTPENGSQTAFVIGTHGEIWFLDIGSKNAMKIISINH
jgi:hypothetical protein